MVLILDMELEEYLPTEEIFSQALYMFDVGQNDVDVAFYSKSEDEVIALIPTLLSAFAYGIEVVIISLFLHNLIQLAFSQLC